MQEHVTSESNFEIATMAKKNSNIVKIYSIHGHHKWHLAEEFQLNWFISFPLKLVYKSKIYKQQTGQLGDGIKDMDEIPQDQRVKGPSGTETGTKYVQAIGKTNICGRCGWRGWMLYIVDGLHPQGWAKK